MDTDRIPPWSLADRLEKARKKTGLSQAAFAAEIDVARSTVVNYEKDDYERARKPIVLKAWAQRCDVPIEWLLGELDLRDQQVHASGWTEARVLVAA